MSALYLLSPSEGWRDRVRNEQFFPNRIGTFQPLRSYEGGRSVFWLQLQGIFFQFYPIWSPSIGDNSHPSCCTNRRHGRYVIELMVEF